mmetsp:Transcript_9648/g.31522  ORF Transcript_9648/g.31522 Transcript_9648/m.31522 type:complete len:347 (-) Transcript_9648:97-1137(-)
MHLAHVALHATHDQLEVARAQAQLPDGKVWRGGVCAQARCRALDGIARKQVVAGQRSHQRRDGGVAQIGATLKGGALRHLADGGEGEHVGIVQVENRARLVAKPPAVLTPPLLGMADIFDDLAVHHCMHARDEPVEVALPPHLLLLQPLLEAQIGVNEAPHALPVVPRIARRRLAQVKVLCKVGRHVLAHPPVDEEIVLLSVAGDDCWWDVALARGADLAGRHLATRVARRKVHARRDEVDRKVRKEVALHELLQQRRYGAAVFPAPSHPGEDHREGLVSVIIRRHVRRLPGRPRRPFLQTHRRTPRRSEGMLRRGRRDQSCRRPAPQCAALRRATLQSTTLNEYQ